MTCNWIIDIKNEFLQEGSEGVLSYTYKIQVTPDAYSKYVFINTVSADTASMTFYEDSYGHILNISVFDRCTEPFNIKIDVWISILANGVPTDKFLGTIEKQYIPEILEEYRPGMERANKMVNSNVSYQLLRANPKLTGNIKVVVTEDSKLYLDTFKVSLALGQYKYRHVPTNVNEYYGRALMHFRKMSTDDFYKVEDNCFNLFTAINDYKAQYYTVYNSGVRTNEDHLYSENYALLAPLCVKEVLPDFFLIFKVNTDAISKSRSVSEADKIKYFLKNGKLVKSFDFRENASLGKYVRNIRENARKYPGDIFASYDIRNYNRFTGISIDRGVVTSAYESLYKEKNINNQVALNDYFTLGFERNKLVSKDIVNFEFMFNDKEESLFSISTYFGIYVSLNGENETFSCIGHDDVYVFDNKELRNIQPGTDLLETEYASLIYGVSTPDEFIRLKDSIYDAPIMESFKLKPYRNIISGEYHNIGEETEYEYVSVSLNKNIKEGEHFRVIDLKNAIIYDVIATGYTKYLKDNISEVCHNYVWYRRMRFTVKTVSAYFEGSLENQAYTLMMAFNKLRAEKTVIKQLRNAISIKTYNTDCIFEKVSSVSDYTMKNEDFLAGADAEDEGITLFGVLTPKRLIINPVYTSGPDNDYFYLYPHYTEGTGRRIVYAGNFQKVPTESLNHTILSDNISDLNDKTIVYLKEDGTPELYGEFDIQEYDFDNNIVETQTKVKYILSPDLESYIVNVEKPKIYNDTLSFYTVYPINSGLCSILPVKDFYFDVLDKDTQINYFAKEDQTPMSTGGEFLVKYTKTDEVPVLSKSEEYITDYFDKTRGTDRYLYTVELGEPLYNQLMSEDDKNAYYSYLLMINHMSSDISLTAPYVCKWKAVGTDARGESMRIMYSYDPSNMKVGHSYYIPYDFSDIVYNNKSKTAVYDSDEMYNTELGYLETNEHGIDYAKYVKTSYNVGLLRNGVNEEGIRLRDGILSGRISIDDLLYTKKWAYNKFSTVYKAGENTIEFISGGIKLKIRSSNSDVLNFNTYAGYQAVFISLPGFTNEHNGSTELIIDEVNKQMAILLYTGTDSVENAFVKPSSIFKVQHTSPLYNVQCVEINGEKCLQVPNDTGLSDALCEERGYLVLTNRHTYNNTDYSTVDDVMIVSTIDSSSEFTYRDSSYITTKNPYIIINGEVQVATNSAIGLHTDFYHDEVDMYVISDSYEYDVNTIVNKESFKKALESCNIYVRKHEGIKDYTNLESFLTFTVVPPYKVEKQEIVKAIPENTLDVEETVKSTYGFVQTTYAVPMTVDVFSFNYSNSSINNSFNRILNGMNTEISGVKTLSQLWINKYTTSSNYCIPIDSSYPRVSIDYIKNISIMDNCWKDSYYEYNVHDFLNSDEYDRIEWRTPVSGYQTGYEKCNFFGSRGINLNGKEGKSIDLTVWKNTKISEKDKCIKLDISESLIYKILFTKGFSDSWRYLGLRSNTYKIKYIKNTILPMLNITSKTVFTLYKFENTKKLMFKDLTSSDDIVEVANVKNELRYENGKYYMYVYPEEMHTYYAKMHIEL